MRGRDDTDEAAFIERAEATRHPGVIDPPEDVAALEALAMWRMDRTALVDAAARAARWAVATRHDAGPDDAPTPVARLDELTDEQRAYLLERVTARTLVAYNELPPAPSLELADGWSIEGEHVVPAGPVTTYPFRVPEVLPERDGVLAHTRGILEHVEEYRTRCVDAPEVERRWLRERLTAAEAEAEEDWREGRPLAFWDPRDGDLDRGPPWVNLIALAVWVLEVAPRVAHARRPVALTLKTLSAIQEALSYRGTVAVLEAGHAPPSTRTRTWVETAAVDGAALTRIQRGTGLLGSVLAPKMLTLLVNSIQRRLDARETLVLSGRDGLNVWEALGAELGVHDEKRVRREVKPLFEALAALHYRTPSGLEIGGLWTWASGNDQGGRGKSGTLQIHPNPALCGIVEAQERGHGERSLVPLPRLPDWCAPMMGGPRNHGGIARLWLWTLCRLREQADDLTRGNGVLIEDWEAAANEVGYPYPLLVQHGLIARWTRDDKGGLAVLEEVAPNRYHLAPHLEAERAMLEEAGRRTIQGRKGGKAAAERRANPKPRRGKPRGF